MRLAASLLLLSLLAACGSREALSAPPGGAMPIAAEAAPRAETIEELLTPPPIARPARLDDSLRRSEEREDDPFDLPPSR
ncbi:MAG: hypothetical protein QOG72_3106 [Sphingomonadales bacterium]|jgi:hypothetical protein|nr:hypothetical protein [Sphingomonadales bacterium]